MYVVGHHSENYGQDFMHASFCPAVMVDPHHNLCIARLNAIASHFSLDGEVDDTLDFSFFPIPGETRTSHERVVHVLKIAECLKRYPGMDWKPRILRMTAMVIDALFREQIPTSALYIMRKSLAFQVPLSAKIFVDRTRNYFFLLPKKSEAELRNDVTVERPVFGANNMGEVGEESPLRLWSVVSKHQELQKGFISFNGNQDCIGEDLVSPMVSQVSATYRFGYLIRSAKTGAVRKQLSLYERYDGDLHSLLSQDNFVREDSFLILRIMKKIAEALLRFHVQDLVFRGVKTKNILVKIGEDHRGADWKVTFCCPELVIDQRLPPERRPKEIRGTLFYMSPELVIHLMEHKKDHFHQQIALFKGNYECIDPQNDDLRPCDIYAMGLVCYQLLFHQEAPWNKESISKIIEAQLSLPLTERPDELTEESVPLVLQYIVLQMMHPRRELRPTIMAVVSFLEGLEQEIYSKKLLNTTREPQ